MNTFKERFEQGEIGYKFFEKVCSLNQIEIKKSTPTQDKTQGIDCFIKFNGSEEEIPLDVKNGKSIVFANIKEDGYYQVRHPFINETKATHYAFVSCTKESDGKYLGIFNIKEFLLKYFFVNEEGLNKFYTVLQSIHEKSHDNIEKEIGTEDKIRNKSQSAFKLKLAIVGLLKKDTSLLYNVNDNTEEFVFKLTSKKLESEWDNLKNVSFEKNSSKPKQVKNKKEEIDLKNIV